MRIRNMLLASIIAIPSVQAQSVSGSTIFDALIILSITVGGFLLLWAWSKNFK